MTSVCSQDIFKEMDDTNTGGLSMNKLQNALQAAGECDDMNMSSWPMFFI